MLQKLTTAQGDVLTGTPWTVYPRPQMRRDSYVNLNGYWDFTVATTPEEPEVFDRKILVPFCPESQLSGIGEHHSPEDAYLFYRRSITLPENFNQGRVLLHIGAADQELTCYVNSQEVDTHHGGYDTITLDITDYLQEENTLLLRCRDDLRRKAYPYGKQTLNRGGMWYTPVSGIWQTVWLESVPETYIQKMVLDCKANRIQVILWPELDGTVTVPGVGEFPLEEGRCRFTVPDPHLWSPDDPYLYDFSVQAGQDRVESYFAVRCFESRRVNGLRRFFLNGKPFFLHGVLDQGYWPDGLFTPATAECYAQDILAMKRLGFNTLRKHIKIEPQEFYYQCDKLGMLVCQDMVNNGSYSFLKDTLLPTLGFQEKDDVFLHPDPEVRSMFKTTMLRAVNQLRSHPSIVYWTIFNEGWGQFNANDTYIDLNDLDCTRFIDTTSGWFRAEQTEVESYHIYFGPWWKLRKKSKKPIVLSEFGGFAYPVKGHLFNPGKAYGYRSFRDKKKFQKALQRLYEKKVIPAAARGLCAAIYTQLSDVEDEINGLLTYDRRVCKADEEAMQQIARQLQQACQD